MRGLKIPSLPWVIIGYSLWTWLNKIGSAEELTRELVEEWHIFWLLGNGVLIITISCWGDCIRVNLLESEGGVV